MLGGDMPQDAEITQFVQEWFDLLSDHEPIERLLSFVSKTDLEMVFPERTLRSHADLREWYATVGETFTDQSHQVEALDVKRRGDTVDIALVVVWKATQSASGERLAVRVNQQWRLTGELGCERPVISRYRVGTMHALQGAC